MKLDKIILILAIFVPNMFAGNHVCYEKNKIIGGEVRYIGCSKEKTFCSRQNKKGFGGYLTKEIQSRAFWQCSNLSKKEIKIITCRKNPSHRWCKHKDLIKIKRDSSNRIRIDNSLGKKMCEQGKSNCLILGGTKSECSNWCR